MEAGSLAALRLSATPLQLLLLLAASPARTSQLPTAAAQAPLPRQLLLQRQQPRRLQQAFPLLLLL
jgi:hypothetical protein